jgi:hypothetical protein
MQPSPQFRHLPPAHFSPLRLPRGNIIFYPTGRPNIRVIKQAIMARGYEVWDLHIDIPGFQGQQIPQADWLHAIVLGRVVLFVAAPEPLSSSRSSSPDSSSGQQSESSPNAFDSDNVDPDVPDAGLRN